MKNPRPSRRLALEGLEARIVPAPLTITGADDVADVLVLKRVNGGMIEYNLNGTDKSEAGDSVVVDLKKGDDTLRLAATWNFPVVVTFTNLPGEGVDTLDLSATSAAGTFKVGDTGTGDFRVAGVKKVGFTGLEKADAGTGTNTVDAATSQGAPLTWTGTAPNKVNVYGIDFTRIANLQGNQGNDTFDLEPGASFTSIAGGSGTNVLGLTGTDAGEKVTLRSSTTNSLTFSRNAGADTTATFTSISQIDVKLGKGDDTLTVADTWDYKFAVSFFNKANEGSDTLQADSSDNTFTLTGDNTGSLKSAKAGANTPIAFSGVEKAQGGTGTNTVDAATSQGANLTWTGTAPNKANVYGIDFTGVARLQGNQGNDTFTLEEGASFDSIKGGQGSNSLKVESVTGSKVDWYKIRRDEGSFLDETHAVASPITSVQSVLGGGTTRITSNGHGLKEGDIVVLARAADVVADTGKTPKDPDTGRIPAYKARTFRVLAADAVAGTFDIAFNNSGPNAYAAGDNWRKATEFVGVMNLEGTAGDDSFTLDTSNGQFAFGTVKGGGGANTLAAATNFATKFSPFAGGTSGSLSIQGSGTNFFSIGAFVGGTQGNNLFDLGLLKYEDFVGAAAVNYIVIGRGPSGNTVNYPAVVSPGGLEEVLFANFQNNTATAIAYFSGISIFTAPPGQPGTKITSEGIFDFPAPNPGGGSSGGGGQVPPNWKQQLSGGVAIFLLSKDYEFDLSTFSSGSAVLVYQNYGAPATVNFANQTASGFKGTIPIPIIGVIGSPFVDTIIGADLPNTWASQSISDPLEFTAPFDPAKIAATINLSTNPVTITIDDSQPIPPATPPGRIDLTFTGVPVSSKGTLDFDLPTNPGPGSTHFQVGFANVENLQGGTASDRFDLDSSAAFGMAAGGGGDNTVAYASAAGSTVSWVGTGDTTGKVQGVGFSQIQHLVGGAGGDTFTLDPHSKFADIDGGPSGPDTLAVGSSAGASIHVATITQPDTLRITSAGHGLKKDDLVTLAGLNGLANATGTFKVSAVTLNTFDVEANGVTGLYVLPPGTPPGTWVQRVNWRGDAAGAGFVIGTTFTHIGNLQGGPGNDSFVLEKGAAFGSINGGGGANDILARSDLGQSTTWGGLGAGSGRVTRNDGLGNINFTDFTNVAALAGGQGHDSFLFSPNAAFTSIDGGSEDPTATFATRSTNTFDYSGFGKSAAVNLQTRKASGVTGTFSHLTRVIGSPFEDTLTGPNINNVWESRLPFGGDLNVPALFDPTNRFDVNFSDIENLVGGSMEDIFALIGNTRFLKLDGSGFVPGKPNAITQTGTAVDDSVILSSGKLSVNGLDTLFANIGAFRLNQDPLHDPDGTDGAGSDTIIIDYTAGPLAGQGRAILQVDGGAGADSLVVKGPPTGNIFYTLLDQSLGVQSIGAGSVDDAILYQRLESLEIRAGSGIDQFFARQFGYGAGLSMVNYINTAGPDLVNLVPSTTTSFFVDGGFNPRGTVGAGLYLDMAGAIVLPPIIVANGGSDGQYNFTNRKTIQFKNIWRGVGGSIDVSPVQPTLSLLF